MFVLNECDLTGIQIKKGASQKGKYKSEGDDSEWIFWTNVILLSDMWVVNKHVHWTRTVTFTFCHTWFNITEEVRIDILSDISSKRITQGLWYLVFSQPSETHSKVIHFNSAVISYQQVSILPLPSQVAHRLVQFHSFYWQALPTGPLTDVTSLRLASACSCAAS